MVSEWERGARAWKLRRKRRFSPFPSTLISSPLHPTTPRHTDPDVRAAIATVRAAAAGGPDRPPPDAVLASVLALERAKLAPTPFFQSITGGSPSGRRWRLTYTAGSAAVKAAMKSGGSADAGGFGTGGAYVPVTAVQRWSAGGGGGGGGGGQAASTSGGGTAQAGAIENGVFLGWLGALVFRGTFELVGRRLPFALDTLRVRVGPKWFEFPISTRTSGGGAEKGSGPFFLVAYVDDGVVVARGKSGGVAVWARAGEEWCARAGVDA